jgi:hypothetical protein
MRIQHSYLRLGAALVAALTLMGTTMSPVFATSTWSDPGTQWNAHAPFTVNMHNNTTGDWPARVQQAAADWSLSPTVDVNLGNSGKVTINNGHFGTAYPCGATIIYKTGNGYIKNVIINLNDDCQGYTPGFQQLTCMEMGHALGLGDYRTDDPVTPSCMAPYTYGPSPSQDDFDQLAADYP